MLSHPHTDSQHSAPVKPTGMLLGGIQLQPPFSALQMMPWTGGPSRAVSGTPPRWAAWSRRGMWARGRLPPTCVARSPSSSTAPGGCEGLSPAVWDGLGGRQGAQPISAPQPATVRGGAACLITAQHPQPLP